MSADVSGVSLKISWQKVVFLVIQNYALLFLSWTTFRNMQEKLEKIYFWWKPSHLPLFRVSKKSFCAGVLLWITNLEREVFCSLRSDLSDNFNFMSLFIAIGVPLVFGPMFCPIGHILLSLIACCKGVSTSTCTLKDPKSHGMLFFFTLAKCSYGADGFFLKMLVQKFKLVINKFGAKIAFKKW